MHSLQPTLAPFVAHINSEEKRVWLVIDHRQQRSFPRLWSSLHHGGREAQPPLLEAQRLENLILSSFTVIVMPRRSRSLTPTYTKDMKVWISFT